MTLNESPAVLLNLVAKANDYYYSDFVVTDNANTPINFTSYKGFDWTKAKLTICKDEVSSVAYTYVSTGATPTITVSDRSAGHYTTAINSLAVPAGTYLYQFEAITNSNLSTVIRYGIITITSDLSK